jgi:hypothetical protein
MVSDIITVSPEELDKKIQELTIERNLILEKALDSSDPSQIMKAQSYLMASQGSKKQGMMRAFMFDPYSADYTGSGYKRPLKKVGFEILKRMGDTHIAKMVRNTRINQVRDYLRFVTDEQDQGFTIRKRKSLFEDRKEPNRTERKEIEFIVKFLENSKKPVEKKEGGINFDTTKWDIFDDFDEFIQMIIDDSLTYDQLTVEIQRNRKFEIVSYKAIDASTIRLLDTIDPRHYDDNARKYDEVLGYLPRYCQVWGSQLEKNPVTGKEVLYYPWELIFAVRNKTTDILKNGYGTSELETLISIMTWILYGMDYNGNFFKQGSNPKGFINIKSGGGGQDVANDFRDMWRQMISGVQNSHKIPVFEGIDLEWVDLQQSNKDMEFQLWVEFLIVMFCAVYTIDPSELGFEFQSASKIFGQDGQKQRLQHSINKGLKPILKFLEKVIDKYIVSEINPDYEFAWCGVDLDDEETKIKNIDMALKAGITSFEKQFEAYEGEKYDEKKHTILNPVFQQAQQMKMYGGLDSNQAVDQMTGEDETGGPNPFAQFERGAESNPILKASLDYIESKFDISNK